MTDKPKILIQLDTDAHASVFDRVVAIDAGAVHLFSYSDVKPEQVPALIHGAMFTRGPKDLHNTAVFVGGSDVAAGEAVLESVRKTLLPDWGLQVSVMLDSNGCNTTAAAAVRAAARHVDLHDATAIVLGGTGPVGQRVARLLTREGARVRVGSRQATRSVAVCDAIRARIPTAQVTAVATGSPAELAAAVADQTIVIAAGAAGIVLLAKAARPAALRIAIDLNAVPPLGIEGVELTDKGTEHDGVIAYGALGVGATKMKVHKAAVVKLFERNDQILDAEEVFEIAKSIG